MREGREKKVTAGSITVSESLDTTGLRALFGRDFPAWKVQITDRILRKKAEQAEEEAKKRKRVRRECANDVAAAANRHFGGKRLRIAGSLGDGVPEAPAVRRTRSCP